MKQHLYKKVFTISLMHINTFKQVLFSMLKNLKYLHTHMDVLGTTSVTCPKILQHTDWEKPGTDPPIY